MKPYSILIVLLAILLHSSCATHSHTLKPILSEKDRLMEQTNQGYPSASVLGDGALHIAPYNPISDFHQAVSNIDGVLLDQNTGVFQMEQAILFDFDSFEVKKEAIHSLSQISEAFLKLGTSSNLEISGHTDAIGSKTYNKALSLKRAKAVSYILSELGIPQERISTRGLGDEAPISSNKTEIGRSQNRRVEFRVFE